jgi:hypothetical protein
MSDALLAACPYKGLLPFSEVDAPFFFGRERERELIADNLRANRLTLLYGPSGVGKSSVLQAGVRPLLRRQARQERLTEGRTPFAVVFFNNWRDDPIPALVDAIQDSVDASVRRQTAPELARLVGASDQPAPNNGEPPGVTRPASLSEALLSANARLNAPVLLILDQFEEYFLYHPESDQPGSFAVELPRALNHPDLRANFLLSIREDALARLDRFKGRIPNLFGNYLRLDHLDLAAGQAAIERPLERYNQQAEDEPPVTIEATLTAAILAQVQTGQIVLSEATGQKLGETRENTSEPRIETPYLQLVLIRLWDEERRQGSPRLRLATLEQLGKARTIVQTHLDTVMGALDSQAQRVAAQLFRQLVTPSGSKIAHSLSDLAQLVEPQMDPSDLAPILKQLESGSVRILRPVSGPGPTRYEIFHDALAPAILNWRRRYVVEEERQRAEERLAEERRQYIEQQERLEADRHLARERRRSRLLGLGLVGVGLLLVLAIALAVFAYQQRELAQAQEKLARSRELAAVALTQLSVDPERSVLVAAEAMRVTQTVQAEDALRRTLAASHLRMTLSHTDTVLSAAYSPDGQQIVTASADRSARVWQASSGALLLTLTGHSDWVRSAAYSPDGQQIVTASDDRSARVYACELCAPADKLPELVPKYVTRALTEAERRIFLLEGQNP